MKEKNSEDLASGNAGVTTSPTANVAAQIEQMNAATGSGEDAGTAAWLAERQFPLVPDEDIVLVSLTGQDYPRLRTAFAKAWDRLHDDERCQLLQGWEKRARDYSHFPRTPWIVAMPHWPCRMLNEFGLTHPSGLSIQFVAPLVEQMPEDLAIGVMGREFGYAHCFVGSNMTAGPMWALEPREFWDKHLRLAVRSFERAVGCEDLTERLAEWVKHEHVVALSRLLEADAYWHFSTIGEHAVSIYS